VYCYIIICLASSIEQVCVTFIDFSVLYQVSFFLLFFLLFFMDFSVLYQVSFFLFFLLFFMDFSVFDKFLFFSFFFKCFSWILQFSF